MQVKNNYKINVLFKGGPVRGSRIRSRVHYLLDTESRLQVDASGVIFRVLLEHIAVKQDRLIDETLFEIDGAQVADGREVGGIYLENFSVMPFRFDILFLLLVKVLAPV